MASNAHPFFTPPTRVHPTPSWLTSACMLSIKLLVESPAFQTSKGIKLCSQQIAGKTNLLWILSCNQSKVKLVSTSIYCHESNRTHLPPLCHPAVESIQVCHPNWGVSDIATIAWVSEHLLIHYIFGYYASRAYSICGLDVGGGHMDQGKQVFELAHENHICRVSTVLDFVGASRDLTL